MYKSSLFPLIVPVDAAVAAGAGGAAADVSIAMGSGTNVAMSVAQLTLMAFSSVSVVLNSLRLKLH